MNRPQTIQIFLPDGSPRSVKIAEITNRMVKAILIPRNKLEYVMTRPELNNVGIYFLFGHHAERAKPLTYIGEAEVCSNRLKDHERNKKFWTHAVVMISKTNSFTKAHAKYLEHISIEEAKKGTWFETANVSSPAKPHVTESMEADLLDSFDTIKILLSTLGYPLFEKLSKEQVAPKELLYLKGKKIYAEGDLIDDGFVVFKGSFARKETTPSCHEYLISLRKKLIKSEIMVEKKGLLEFTQDYVFSSPSTAGGVILGRNTNGWTIWRNKDGVKLDELKRNSLKTE